jgi:hypothetical protein
MNVRVSLMTKVHRTVYHYRYTASSVEYRRASILYLQELRLCCAAPNTRFVGGSIFLSRPALLEHSTGLRLTYL